MTDTIKGTTRMTERVGLATAEKNKEADTEVTTEAAQTIVITTTMGDEASQVIETTTATSNQTETVAILPMIEISRETTHATCSN
jgi:hypothetical protein